MILSADARALPTAGTGADRRDQRGGASEGSVMALELHLRDGALGQALTAHVQHQLFTMCGPAVMSELFVDHVDTVPGSVTVAELSPARLEVRLSLTIHTVTRAQVLASPGGVPAMNAPVPAVVVVWLGIQGRALVIEQADSDLSTSQLPSLVRAAAESAIDALLAPLEGTVLVDLQPVVQALGSQVPAEPSLGHAGGVMGLRLGGSGPFVPHLAAHQAWGVFLDAQEAIALLTRQQPAGLPTQIRWLPNGATPAMDGSLTVSGPFYGAAVHVTARPTLVPPSTLRLSISWGVNLTGVASVLEALARKLIREWVRRRFADATHDGAQSFHYDLTLPPVPALLGAEPEWQSIDSSPAGMTIGGPVRPAPEGERGLLVTSVTGFGKPVWWGNCRRNGEPPRTFERDAPRLRVQAGVGFSDAGRLCDAQILSPNEWLTPHLSAGADGLGFDLSVGTAALIADDVTILVRTARGTRFFNLGRPVIRGGPEGGIDVQRNWFDNCPKLSGAWLKLAIGEALTVEDFRPVPLEDPNWIALLGARQGLVSHVVQLGRLEPGELVTVRGHRLAVEVRADDAGELTAPALVALSGRMREVVLERSAGDLVEGTVRVHSTHLTWLANLGPAQAAAVVDVGHGARVVRETDGAVHAVEYRPAEGLVEVGDEVQLNPRPLPPEPPDALRLAAAAGLDDVRTAQALPGMDATHLAVAQLGDGEQVVVTVDGGTPHVAGSYRGPVVGMQVDGRYAVARSGGSLHLFAVTPLQEMAL